MLEPMWKLCRAILGTLLCCVGAWGQAQPLITLDPQTGEQPLAGRMEWLEDESTHMTLDEVRHSGDWTPLAGMPNAGYTSSAIWLRLRLQQPSSDIDWILSIDDSLLDEGRLYIPLLENGWAIQRAGLKVDRSMWPMGSRIPAYRLRLAPGEHEVYLRLQGVQSLSYTLRLQTKDGFLQQSARDGLLYGIYYGLFFASVALQFFFWMAARDVLSGWYLLYSLVLLLVTSLRAGHPQELLDFHQPGLNLLGLITLLAPLAVVRLTAIWLDIGHHAPRLNLLFQSSAYVMAALTTGMLLMGDAMRPLQLGQILTLFWFTISFSIAGWLWRHKVSAARDYLLVFGVMIAFMMVRFLRNLGLLPVNFFTDYALYIGTMMHLLLVCIFFIQRYRSLQYSLDSERRAREEQRDFVGMVSHEFRTPLAIINTSIQQLATNLDAPAEKSLQRAQNIRQAIQRMNLLLDDYLSLDRLDTAQQALQPRRCDFYEVIEDAASDWPVQRIRIRIENLPSPFVCDPDLMRIVLRNLLANAVRHSPGDSVVELAVTGLPGDRLHIRVQDHGEGVPADELPRLFQRYFRGRNSQGQPGAGLGLHLVQRIVTLHGGSIEVQSTAGEGTTFLITLPPGQLPRR